MTYREKLESLSFRARTPGPKVTTDELGHETVEHFDDRVDVTIHAKTLRATTTVKEDQ